MRRILATWIYHYYIRFCANILRIILRRMVSAIQVINALSSGKSLVVFDLIASEGGDRKSIIDSLRLSHKQYNSAISALRKSGLVEKINGRYIINLFGEVVHEARQLIETGLREYWQLKAIDAIWRELPKERDETIEALIGDQEIRELLIRRTRPVIAKQNQHH
jgi:predicted transcriptional regulator